MKKDIAKKFVCRGCVLLVLCLDLMCIFHLRQTNQLKEEMVRLSETEEQTEKEDEIRVLIHQEENDYLFHELIFTSETSYRVYRESEIIEYPANSEYILNCEKLNNEIYQIKSVHSKGKIIVKSIERNQKKPNYSGVLEIYPYNDGFLLINIVPIEDYVAEVIPGEMPMGFQKEALKAQAVCARTYAVRALKQGFRDYPAHVDDSVQSQVYHGTQACEASKKIAEDTFGQILYDGGQAAEIFFFSTSCGVTSNPEDIWKDSKEKHHSSQWIAENLEDKDLSDENQFIDFIKNDSMIPYYEEECDLFRWTVEIQCDLLRSKILEYRNLDIGKIKHISILERAGSGVIKKIGIYGDTTIVLESEYEIRKIFSPIDSVIYGQNGTTYMGWNMLPSGYFYMEFIENEEVLQGIKLYGGGYGHGCGVSQNAANVMAERGWNYIQILKFFYKDGVCQRYY